MIREYHTEKVSYISKIVGITKELSAKERSTDLVFLLRQMAGRITENYIKVNGLGKLHAITRKSKYFTLNNCKF